MKTRYFILSILCFLLLTQFLPAQTAYRLKTYASLPAFCNPLNGEVAILTTTGQAYQCTGTGTWGSLGLNNSQQFTSTQGTLTGASTPFISHTVTWNNAATSFIDDLRNITVTASTYPGSAFQVFELAGTPVLEFDQDGDIEQFQPTQTGASNPFLTHTTTWNNAGTTFIDDMRTITSTASAASSLLAEYNVNGSNVLVFGKAGNIISQSTIAANSFGDNNECFSGAQPAVCGASTAGDAAIVSGTATTVVDTTAVTANSVIELTQDNSVGGKISQTCTATGIPLMVTARTPGTSFTVGTSTGANVAANYECFTFQIRN